MPAATASPAAPVLLWFRNDLRVADNAALIAALNTGRPVLPVFVLDTASAGQWAPGGAARWWLHHSLASLGGELRARGSTLVLRRGPAAEVIPALARETGAHAVHAGRSHEPWARRRDQAVAAALKEQGIRLHRHRTVLLFDPEAIRTRAGGSFGVYTPFSRACFAQAVPPPCPAPIHIPCPALPASDRLEQWRLLPAYPDWAGGLREAWLPGAAGAAKRLARFMDRALPCYGSGRDRPGEDGTSMLSPHLHWGEVSPAQVWHAAEAAAGCVAALQTFLKELLWREFSAHLLWHHPDLPTVPLRPEFARFPWAEDARACTRGSAGRLACRSSMRECASSGAPAGCTTGCG